MSGIGKSLSFKLGGSSIPNASPSVPVLVQETQDAQRKKLLVTQLNGDRFDGDGGGAVGEDAPLVIPLSNVDPVASGERSASEANDLPMLLRNRVAGIEHISDEDEKFRHDLSARPKELDVHSDTYQMVPIGKFGEGLLRGMGWAPGEPIGNTNKQHVEPVEFIARHFRLGLGAAPGEEPQRPSSTSKKDKKRGSKKKKKFIKPGQSREPAKMMAVVGPDGRQRSVRRLSEKLTTYKPAGVFPGNHVKVVAGPHRGITARVVSLNPKTGIALVAFASTERASIPSSELEYISDADLKQLMAEAHTKGDARKRKRSGGKQGGDREASSSTSKSASSSNKRTKARTDGDPHQNPPPTDPPPLGTAAGKGKKRRHHSSSSSKHGAERASSSSSSSSSRKRVWIQRGLMVRIVSKSFARGQFYRTKVRVVDVTAADRCTVRLGDGRMIEGVRQGKLETVIPGVGDRVLVLEGHHKGRKGKVIEKHVDRGVAFVRVDGDIDKYDFDHVCHWVGNNT